MTLEPDAVGPDDVRPLLAAGASPGAVVDALYVCFLFNVYDRLADTLGWEVPPPEMFRRTARILIDRGYA